LQKLECFHQSFLSQLRLFPFVLGFMNLLQYTGRCHHMMSRFSSTHTIQQHSLLLLFLFLVVIVVSRGRRRTSSRSSISCGNGGGRLACGSFHNLDQTQSHQEFQDILPIRSITSSSSRRPTTTTSTTSSTLFWQVEFQLGFRQWSIRFQQDINVMNQLGYKIVIMPTVVIMRMMRMMRMVMMMVVVVMMMVRTGTAAV